MKAIKKRQIIRQRKKWRIRKRITGNQERPRVSVFRSSKHIYLQLIDDVKQVTLLSVNSKQKDVISQLKGSSGNKETAHLVGKLFGEKVKEQGYSNIVFDRNGFRYHGRVQATAEGIREAGIQV